MRKRRKQGGSGDNWLTTYGDVVTLLLCFFVMLHSMSSMDSAKWEILVKSFNPSAEELSQIVDGAGYQEGEYFVDGQAERPIDTIENFDDLYYELSKYVEENSLDTDVEISKGDGFTFITFKNNIFFDGDSYKLKEDGKKVLDDVAYAIHDVNDSIEEIRVLGHTSQAKPNEVNEIVSDRFLSSNRATEVLVYFQKKNLIDPSKLVSSSYGQFRPISPFDSRENRAKNRRVEILITKSNGVTKSLQEYYQEAYGSE